MYEFLMKVFAVLYFTALVTFIYLLVKEMVIWHKDKKEQHDA